MNLPENYIPVVIKENRLNKTIGVGFVNTYSYELYVFTPKDMIEYNAKEVKELLRLYNPVDGIEYNLDKLFNL